MYKSMNSNQFSPNETCAYYIIRAFQNGGQREHKNTSNYGLK